MLKRFDKLRQKDSVEKYQLEFEKLAQGFLLYNDAYDDTYFVTRFVDGLKEEICSVISLHKTIDVNTASALALLQEELARSKGKFGGYSRGKVKSSYDKTRVSESEKGKGEGQSSWPL